jgi:hypothetical protein
VVGRLSLLSQTFKAAPLLLIGRSVPDPDVGQLKLLAPNV